ERVRSVAADEYRRLRLLHGLWPRPDRIKVDVFAVKLGGVFGPDLLHGQHAFTQHLPSHRRSRPVILHLLAVPSAADAEEHATAGDEVGGRDLLREHNWIALDDETDARAELDRRRDRRRR